MGRYVHAGLTLLFIGLIVACTRERGAGEEDEFALGRTPVADWEVLEDLAAPTKPPSLGPADEPASLLSFPEAELLVLRISPEFVDMVLPEDADGPLRDAVMKLYTATEFYPLFLGPDLGNQVVNELIQFLAGTFELGLDPWKHGLKEVLALTQEHCRRVSINSGRTSLDEALERALGEALPPSVFSVECDEDWWLGMERMLELDVMLTRAYVSVARALAGPGQSDVPLWTGAKNAVANLIKLVPKGERYLVRVAALRRFLGHELRRDLPVLGKWGTLRRGNRGRRVKLLKKRLVAEGFLSKKDASRDLSLFDEPTQRAVLAYRAAYGLLEKATVEGPMLDILSRDAGWYVGHLWRSLNRTLENGEERADDYVLVNIPAFFTHLVLDGRIVASYRSVVGFKYKKSGGRTPEVNSFIEYIDLNPTWTPTPYVVEMELGRKLARDSSFLEKQKFVEKDGRLVQLPGPHNTLGQVLLGFPNDRNIYLHGTPDLKPFSYAERALSHGCIRVENIEDLALRIFEACGIELDRPLDEILSGVIERRVTLPRPIPVHLIYDRVRVLEGGKIAVVPDIYGLLKDSAAIPPPQH